MSLIIASSGRGPTDEQFDTLKAKVDRLANSAKELSPAKLQSAVEQALRPLAAEIALMEKEMGMRNGMLLNRRTANDDFAGVDLNAQMDDKS
ncbi:MAG: hypothetical protein Devi2KO_14940 [Devosia indica]